MNACSTWAHGVGLDFWCSSLSKRSPGGFHADGECFAAGEVG